MRTQINLYHLQYFCDAALHGSVSEAAKINFVSQSAVSQAIAKLEIMLNTPLFIRSRKKFQLSPEGKIIFEHASMIFKMVEEIQDKVAIGKDIVAGKVNFVTTNSLGKSFIPPVYLNMKEKYPHVDIHCHLGNLSLIRNMLRQREVEFAITLNQPEWDQYDKKALKKGLFQLYQHEDADAVQLKKGVLIDFHSGLYVQELLDHFAQHHYPPLEVQQALSAWEVVARFTELNSGIGFFPDYLMSDQQYPKLTPCSFAIPHFDYEICAVYPKGETLSRAASVFLDLFAEESPSCRNFD